MARRFDTTIASPQRHLDAESEPELDRRMRFPTRWDPFFTDTMTLRDAYHYATQHFDFHWRQFTSTSPTEYRRGRSGGTVRCAVVECCGAVGVLVAVSTGDDDPDIARQEAPICTEPPVS